MDRSNVEQLAFLRPVEVARLLRCSEWWVKEQARRRRVPFIRIGGRYLFTAEHVAEIVRRFEVRPVEEPSVTATSARRGPNQDIDLEAPAMRLSARIPRRLRSAGSQAA